MMGFADHRTLIWDNGRVLLAPGVIPRVSPQSEVSLPIIVCYWRSHGSLFIGLVICFLSSFCAYEFSITFKNQIIEIVSSNSNVNPVASGPIPVLVTAESPQQGPSEKC